MKLSEIHILICQIDFYQERRLHKTQAKAVAICCKEKVIAKKLERSVSGVIADTADVFDGVLSNEQYELIGKSWSRFVQLLSVWQQGF